MTARKCLFVGIFLVSISGRGLCASLSDAKSCFEVAVQLGDAKSGPTLAGRIAAADKLAGRCAKNADFQLAYVNGYLAAGQVDRAESILKQALAAIPESFALRERRAYINFRTGDVNSAIAQEKVLMHERPDAAAPYIALAGMEGYRKNWEACDAYAKKAYEIAKDPKLLMVRVRALHQMEQNEEAARLSSLALEAKPALIMDAGIPVTIFSLMNLSRNEEASALLRRRIAADANWKSVKELVIAAEALKVN